MPLTATSGKEAPAVSPMPPEAEILRKHQEIYLNKFGRERYERFIQLPLRPGEAIHPVTDWTED